MYKPIKDRPTSIKRNTTYKGETIEEKVKRVTTNKEPIKDGAPLIYTERKDGVQAQYDIRSDRFEIAIEATDYISRSIQAKRESNLGKQALEGMKKEEVKDLPAEGKKD